MVDAVVASGRPYATGRLVQGAARGYHPASGVGHPGREDLVSLNHVYRRSALSNVDDRALLLAHPEVLELTADSLTTGRTRVVAVEESVVGFATTSLHDDRLELDDLFVDPDWWRRGIARDLVSDASAIARASGVDHIEVTANDHAAGFYERTGFVKIGVASTPLGVPAARLRRPASLG
jgi:GNAT superfamily N-acetyltransferase